MAASNYNPRVTGALFCAYSTLIDGIGALDSGARIAIVKSPRATAMFDGMAAMIGNEIVKVTRVFGSTMFIGRGCADTIPTAHPAGTPVYFFDKSFAYDNRAYNSTATVAVKIQPRSFSGASVPLEYSPPQTLAFTQRMIRPYPPGRVLMNDRPFDQPCIVDENTDLVLTWAHRNRVTQMDQLIDHSIGSITPEAGTTYNVQIVDANGGGVRYASGITGATFTYQKAQIKTDFPVVPGGANKKGTIYLRVNRGGYDGREFYKLSFIVSAGELQFIVDQAGNNISTEAGNKLVTA